MSPKLALSQSVPVPLFASRRTSIFYLVRSLMDSWYGAIFGGSVYGAWAAWANWDQGAAHALGIGLAHWTTSALLTFFGTMAMRSFYGNGPGRVGGLRALLGGLCLTYASLLLVHTVLRTEHVLLTLAPGILPNVLFCTSYALLLMRTQPIGAPS